MQFNKIWDDFLLGLKSTVEGGQLLFTSKLSLYLIPSAVIAVFAWLTITITTWIFGGIGSLIESISWLSWLTKGTASVFEAMVFGTSKFMVLTLFSPLLAFLSEKVEQHLTGNEYPFNWEQFIKDILRAVGITLYNMMKQLMMVIIWGIIAWVTGLQELSPFVIPIIGFYFIGYTFLDYIAERQRMSFKETNKFMKLHLGLALSIGMVFHFLFQGWVIYLGIAVAGPLLITSATIAAHSILNLNNSKYANQKESD